MDEEQKNINTVSKQEKIILENKQNKIENHPESKQELSKLQNVKNTASNVFCFIKKGVWDGMSDVKETNDVWAKLAFAETMGIMCLYAGISPSPFLVSMIALTGVKKMYEGTCMLGYYTYSHMQDCLFKNKKINQNQNFAKQAEEMSEKNVGQTII